MQPNNIHNAYAKCYTNCCFWLYGFFDLVRSDSMAFIHLTGLPYCNASRYCEFLSTNSPVFGGHQSISRVHHRPLRSTASARTCCSPAWSRWRGSSSRAT